MEFTVPLTITSPCELTPSEIVEYVEQYLNSIKIPYIEFNIDTSSCQWGNIYSDFVWNKISDRIAEESNSTDSSSVDEYDNLEEDIEELGLGL
jgi:hypothetical protein